MEQDELREWERKCIQEEPPECLAACPIHVDARMFVKEMASGDREGAFKALAKSMPFPNVLARICDHPCESRCKRGEVDEPIAIGLLERACVEQSSGKVRVQLLPRRREKIAVLGGGLAGLTAAWDLLKKGFAVTILESEKRLGGRVWDAPEGLLPPEVIAADFAVLETLKADIRLEAETSSAVLEALIEEYDAVFVDRSAVGGVDLGLGCDNSGLIVVDGASGVTDRDRVFAGGGGTDAAWSPVNDSFEGRRGALSIERMIQKAQMGAGRENDGASATRLFTSVEGIEPAARVRPVNAGAGYHDAEARAEAARCIQCECMECVKVCLYLERYEGYPKKYARQVFNNERVIYGAAHTKNQFANSCTDCGLCETVCPNDLHMGDLCLQARRTLNDMGIMPAAFHEFALSDMAYSNSEAIALARPEPGDEAPAWLYFPSCQLSATAPGEVVASYRYLREKLADGVGIVLGCCGAPAYWAGRNDLFGEAIDAFRAQWEALGRPKVITACTTCQGLLGEHVPGLETVSLWEIVAREGLPVAACAATGTTVSITDPCTSRHDGELHAQVRQIAGALGIGVEELALSGDKPECCGYGGLVFNANPKLAADVIGHRASAASSGDAAAPARPVSGWFRTQQLEDRDTRYYHTEVTERDYIAYCAMCRDRLADAGKRVSHLIEQVFPVVEGADPAARGWISWTERRRNRAKVRREILRELGETVNEGAEMGEGIVLQMTPEVRRRVDERRILEDDIAAVIEYAEQTGQRMRNEAVGLYRAYRQLENVTFWVDYSPSDDGFVVHNAYCHRMKIVGVMK